VIRLSSSEMQDFARNIFNFDRVFDRVSHLRFDVYAYRIQCIRFVR
jgi:hypothetical protein